MEALLDGIQGKPSTGCLPLYSDATSGGSLQMDDGFATCNAAYIVSPAGGALSFLGGVAGILQSIPFVPSGGSSQGGTCTSQNGTLTDLFGTWWGNAGANGTWAVVDHVSTPVLNEQGTPGRSLAITQSGGGSIVFQPILFSHLPCMPQPSVATPSVATSPVATPSAPIPSLHSASPPIDIAQVLLNPPAAFEGPIPGGESIPLPVVAGSGPSTPGAPLSGAAKPDVEGNRGKSQLIDVASSQTPPSDESPASSPDMLAQVSFTNGDFAATDSDLAAAGLPAAANTPLVAGGEPSTMVAQISRGTSQNGKVLGSQGQLAGDTGEERTAGAAATSLAVTDGKAEEKASKPLAAEKYDRAEIVGLAVLAFTGQHLAKRLPRCSPGQPRPITIRRKKVDE